MTLIQLKNRIDIILSFPFTIFFNFYYLPFRQAIKIPIILYRPSFYGLGGHVKIVCSNLHFGMIHLGRRNGIVLQRKGFWYQNQGGTIIFRGMCHLGAGTTLFVGENATLDIGDRISNAVALNIDCRYRIKINGPSEFGWDVILMDSAMHTLKNDNGMPAGKGYGEIVIGSNNWITTKCIVLAGSRTPDFCIAATSSLLNKDYSGESPRCLLAGCPAQVKRYGIWRDFDDCRMIYTFF